MVRRFWFYLPVAIVLVAMSTYLIWHNSRQANTLAAINVDALEQRQAALANYLNDQKDGRKLISLAKRYQKTQPELIEPVALKAYELLPDSRDAALLASNYRPELMEKVKELDPLYSP